MRTLDSIRTDICNIIDILEAGDPIAAEAFDKELKIEAEEKLVNYFKVIQAKMSKVAHAEMIVKNAQEFKKREESDIEWLEGRIRDTMVQLQLKKIDRADARITLVQKDVFRRCKDDAVPLQFCTPVITETIKVDWKAVEAAVKSGEEIAGCKVEIGGSKYLMYPKLKKETE
jgi:hypothetical protein